MNVQSLALESIHQRVSEAGGFKPTLAALSVQLKPGCFHVVRGPSGAGKTTLLSIVALATRPAGGRIVWEGLDLAAADERSRAAWRRRHLGLVFQASRLVSVMSVRDHIKLAAAIRCDPQAEQHGLRRLEQLGLADRLHQFPGQLSGGEKQRVGLAQALAARPAVLLADEPTAALDQANAQLVTMALRDYARESGAIIVCVSHDQLVIDAADALISLNKPS